MTVIEHLLVFALVFAAVATVAMILFGWAVGSTAAGVGVGLWLAAGFCWLQGVVD